VYDAGVTTPPDRAPAAGADLEAALAARLPDVLRWGGAVARRLRGYPIALGGKTSGRADTDALTLADLAVQELVVAALRDAVPAALACRVEAEEAAGDLDRFARDADLAIGLDPIDGTRAYRDRTGPGYGVMVHLRSAATVLYSLVYFPEEGPEGSWLEVRGDRVAVGADDPARPARAVLDALPAVDPARRPPGRRILVNGFDPANAARARLVDGAGLEGVLGQDAAGSAYPRLARGDLAGVLIHTPNVYDFPVALHVARALGGDAVWVADGRPVHFRERWLDRQAGMLRLPGIVACAADPALLPPLVALARDWSPVRYAG
jgi:3'(2'), 5'-bisphosphate nucleotidase